MCHECAKEIRTLIKQLLTKFFTKLPQISHMPQNRNLFIFSIKIAIFLSVIGN